MLRAEILRKRRADLIERSDQLRRQFSADASAVAAKLAVVDRVLFIQRSGLARLIVGAGATLLLFRGPRRLLRIAARIAPFYPWIKPWIVRWWRSRRREGGAV